MSGSLVRFLSAVAFNVLVAVVFRLFGAGLSTCWFTFLGLTLFVALGLVDQHMYVIESKLDLILEGQQTGKALN